MAPFERLGMVSNSHFIATTAVSTRYTNVTDRRFHDGTGRAYAYHRAAILKHAHDENRRQRTTVTKNEQQAQFKLRLHGDFRQRGPSPPSPLITLQLDK